MKRKMNTSTAILTGLMIFLIILMLGGILYIRNLANPERQEEAYSDKTLNSFSANTLQLEIPETIRKIQIKGPWESDIRQGEHAVMNIEIPENLNPSDIQWNTRGTTLILSNTARNRSEQGTTRATITLPALESLYNEGIIDVDFSGFQGETLNITSSGIIDLSSSNNHFKDLNITLSGAGSVDLSQTLTDNADIILSGAGSVELNMNGGELEGVLSGVGNIEYRGEISRNSIKTSGLGRVSQSD